MVESVSSLMRAKCTVRVRVIIILCGLLAGCGGRQEASVQPMKAPESATANTDRHPEPPLRDLPTAIAVASDPVRAFTIETHLIVEQDVTVLARMSGIVEKIFVERGSSVRKGKLLLKLLNRDLALEVQRAEITKKLKEAEFMRIRELFDEQAISLSEYEESQLNHEGAGVELEIAREELEKSLVRAPFDGLIVERFAKIGQKVIEEENVPLFRLTKLSPLQARLYLPERIARSLEEGDEVKVIPRYLSGVITPGRIEWISPVIDASSGTSLAMVSVPVDGEDAKRLQPGTAVTIVLNVETEERGVLIPRSALGGDGRHDGAQVVEVLQEGRRILRTVRVGEVHGEEVEILEGLQSGERVFLVAGTEPSPPATAEDGQR
jgi:RND family efflux transporter MFP subunit